MTDTLFDSPEKIAAAIANFTNLKSHPGWQLLCQILDANIEVVTNLILNDAGDKEESLEFIKLLRDRLKTYKNVRNTPDDILQKLTKTEPERPNLDPYSTADDLNKLRNQTT